MSNQNYTSERSTSEKITSNHQMPCTAITSNPYRKGIGILAARNFPLHPRQTMPINIFKS